MNTLIIDAHGNYHVCNQDDLDWYLSHGWWEATEEEQKDFERNV